MLLRSWMGFQTLVILRGQDPDTPTPLEALRPKVKRKYRHTILQGKVPMKIDIYGFLLWIFFLWSTTIESWSDRGHDTHQEMMCLSDGGLNCPLSDVRIKLFRWRRQTGGRVFPYTLTHLLPLRACLSCMDISICEDLTPSSVAIYRGSSMLSLQSSGFPVNPQGLASAGDLWLASGQLTHW